MHPDTHQVILDDALVDCLKYEGVCRTVRVVVRRLHPVSVFKWRFDLDYLGRQVREVRRTTLLR